MKSAVEQREAFRIAHDVPRETMERLDAFVSLLLDEAMRQNLISASTIPDLWTRHILDSAQLLPLAATALGPWVDLGSGAGFPGLIVAALGDRPVTLVESRVKRVDFLHKASEVLQLGDRLAIHHGRAETMPDADFAVISARAFAPLDRLLQIGIRFAARGTLWVLPKGRGADNELEAARRSWHGDFRLAPSVTDPEASIIVAERIRRRNQR